MSQTRRVVVASIAFYLVSQAAWKCSHQAFAESPVCVPQVFCSTYPSECSAYYSPQNVSARYYPYTKRKVIALILARGGSKGVPMKNLRSINGVSLLARSLKVVHESGVFGDVWVSTDHMSIAEEAFKYGANVHIRPESVSGDMTASIASVMEFLQHHRDVENVGLVQCTSVFLKSAYLREAFHKFQSADCVFSVVRSWKLRWKELVNEQSMERLVPLNFSPDQRPRRQDWKGELLETGMFYFASRKLLRSGRFQNDICRFVEIMAKDSLEIDTQLDLNLASFLVENDKN